MNTTHRTFIRWTALTLALVLLALSPAQLTAARAQWDDPFPDERFLDPEQPHGDFWERYYALSESDPQMEEMYTLNLGGKYFTPRPGGPTTPSKLEDMTIRDLIDPEAIGDRARLDEVIEDQELGIMAAIGQKLAKATRVVGGIARTAIRVAGDLLVGAAEPPPVTPAEPPIAHEPLANP